jgi:transcriptional regulator with PAS, ATPase and Fis domain
MGLFDEKKKEIKVVKQGFNHKVKEEKEEFHAPISHMHFDIPDAMQTEAIEKVQEILEPKRYKTKPQDSHSVLDFYKEVEKLERELIEDALREAKGGKAEAARLLNLNRTTLIMKCKKLGIMA